MQLFLDISAIKVDIKNQSVKIESSALNRKNLDSISNVVFVENYMATRIETQNTGIFPNKAFSSIFNPNYKTIDFSSILRGPTNLDAVAPGHSPQTPAVRTPNLTDFRDGDDEPPTELLAFESVSEPRINCAINASESESADVIVGEYSCDLSELDVIESEPMKNDREPRVPNKLDTLASQLEMRIAEDETRTKYSLNTSNEFIPVESEIQLAGSDENDVVLQHFDPKRKRTLVVRTPSARCILYLIILS